MAGMAKKSSGGRKVRVLGALLALVLIVALSAYLYLRSPAPTVQNVQAVEVRAQLNPFLLEYPTPGSEALPNAIAVDSAGNVWTVLQNRTELVEFTPGTSMFKTFPFPLPGGTKVMTWGLAVDDSRRLVWVADETSDVIWCFNTTSSTFRETAIPTVGATPFQIVLDSRGNAWFTEFVGDKIGTVSTSGVLTETPIPIVGNPTGIAMDSQGRIWFNLLQTAGVSDLYYVGSYYGGSFNFYNLTNRVDTPVGIAVDSSGHVWLTQHGASLLSEYYPATGEIKTFSTSIPKVGASLPYFVYVDPSNGNVWFNEHYGNAIGEFNPSTGQMVEYHVPPGPSTYGNISGVLTMNLAASGIPWFAEVYTGKIGTLNFTVPIDLSLALNGVKLGQIIHVSNESSASLQVTVTGSGGGPELLSAAVGNATNPLRFSFLPGSGTANSTTTLTISDSSTLKGDFLVTISATSGDLTVSQVVEVGSD
jgi:virginiamycin B lyase